MSPRQISMARACPRKRTFARRRGSPPLASSGRATSWVSHRTPCALHQHAMPCDAEEAAVSLADYMKYHSIRATTWTSHHFDLYQGNYTAIAILEGLI